MTQTNTYLYSSTQNYLTNVGVFTGSASAYGTYDQNGNVWNWTDAVIGSSRSRGGGSWSSLYVFADLFSLNQFSNLTPNNARSDTGFRVATVPTTAPEPTVAVSLILACGLLLSRRRDPLFFSSSTLNANVCEAPLRQRVTDSVA